MWNYLWMTLRTPETTYPQIWIKCEYVWTGMRNPDWSDSVIQIDIVENVILKTERVQLWKSTDVDNVVTNIYTGSNTPPTITSPNLYKESISGYVKKCPYLQSFSTMLLPSVWNQSAPVFEVRRGTLPRLSHRWRTTSSGSPHGRGLSTLSTGMGDRLMDVQRTNSVELLVEDPWWGTLMTELESERQ